MWTIVAVACLVARIDECKGVSLTSIPTTSKQECRYQGELVVNEWGKSNKGWFIRRWDCEKIEYR